MNNDTNWMIGILYHDIVVNVAIKFVDGVLTQDQIEYYLESENKIAIRELLPQHLKTLGPIVAISPLFDVQIIKKGM